MSQEKTFRQKYKDAKLTIIINVCVMLFNIWNLRNALALDRSSGRTIVIMTMIIAITAAILLMIKKYLEMRKAKDYIVFDNFLDNIKQ